MRKKTSGSPRKIGFCLPGDDGRQQHIPRDQTCGTCWNNEPIPDHKWPVRHMQTIPNDWLDLILAETARRCIKGALARWAQTAVPRRLRYADLLILSKDLWKYHITAKLLQIRRFMHDTVERASPRANKQCLQSASASIPDEARLTFLAACSEPAETAAPATRTAGRVFPLEGGCATRYAPSVC